MEDSLGPRAALKQAVLALLSRYSKGFEWVSQHHLPPAKST